MAIKGIFDDTNALTKPKNNTGLFSNINTGGTKIGEQVTGGIGDMLSGSAYDAYKAQSNQKLSRAIANLRNSTGNMYGQSVGQGSYDRAQQATERSIFSQLSEQNLAADVEKQAMKERGITAATNLAGMEAENRRSDTETQRAQDVLYGYTDAFGNRVRGSQELAGEQTDIQRLQAESAKTLGEAGLALDTAKLTETARQFNISTEQANQQFKDTLTKDYASLSQQERQFIAYLGLDQAKFEQAKIEFAQSLAQERFIAMQNIGVQKAQIDETARQFNISTEQTANQFAQSMRYNYDQLSQEDKHFLESLGFDRAKFEQAKYEFAQTYEQTERLTTAQLSQQDKALAEEARQFNSELAFKKSELAANLSEARATRIWQAVQNDKALDNTYSIAQMQNNTERWKTNEAAKLTRAGWTQEAAQAKLDRDLQVTLAEKDAVLQKWVTSAQITQQEADRAQQASQFSTQMAWEREATKLGISADEAARAWQTNERVATQAFQKSEASLDRQLDKEIESGRLTFQEKQLATQISQFATEQEFRESELAANLSEADKNRLWQSSENAKDQLHEVNMQQLQNALSEKGWSMDALLSAVEFLPEEQVAQVLSQMAVQSGLSYVKTDANGNPMKDPETGEDIMVPGLKTIPPPTFDEGWSTNSKLTENQVTGVLQNKAKYIDSGILLTDNYVESLDPVAWDGANVLRLTDDAKKWAADNAGKMYQASNGRLYEVVGTEPYTGRTGGGKEYIVFRDMLSDTLFKYTRGSEFPEV